MNLRQIAARGPSQPAQNKQPEVPNSERFLTLLAEGAALGVPEIDAQAYRQFRANVSKLALRLPDRLPDGEKLALIQAIVKEFATYRNGAEAALRDRVTAWRSLVSFLFGDLLSSLGIETSAPGAQLLTAKIANVTADRIGGLRIQLEEFLHPQGADSAPVAASQFCKADHSTENDNAAGLRGGGSAIEHLKRIIESGGKGFVVVFRLTCLNMINQRFGPEAVEDSLMAVAAFLTQSLHSDDAIYHWSDSSLLAILQGRANEQILTAELQRIAMQNREITVNIGGRSAMLHVPISFNIIPIERLQSAEDLYKITLLASNRSA